MYRLFCYGTLEFPEVMQAVVGRIPPSEVAALSGYCRYAIRGETYPAIIAEPGKEVVGTLFQQLTEKEILLLDNYEGSLYQRLELTVANHSGLLMDVMAYVIAPEFEGQLSRNLWIPRAF